MEHLPADFPAAILVVLHIAPSAVSALPAILTRAGPLPASAAQNGDRYRGGHTYVAPPDQHLLVHADQLRLSHGPRVNGHRPAIDSLFRSAARWRGERVISVVLSGVLDDGTAGTSVVKRAGGITTVQEPDTALYRQMPSNALEIGGARHSAPLPELAKLLDELVREEIPDLGGGIMSTDVEHELEVDPEAGATVQGPASAFTCPDCHGALWELRDADLVRYLCRIGHSYGPETLVAQQSEKIEEALWAGYRTLEESAALSKRLSDDARARGAVAVADRYQSASEDALERARTLRAVLQQGQVYSSTAHK